jgi:hypothetical protein
VDTNLLKAIVGWSLLAALGAFGAWYFIRNIKSVSFWLPGLNYRISPTHLELWIWSWKAVRRVPIDNIARIERREIKPHAMDWVRFIGSSYLRGHHFRYERWGTSWNGHFVYVYRQKGKGKPIILTPGEPDEFEAELRRNAIGLGHQLEP